MKRKMRRGADTDGGNKVFGSLEEKGGREQNKCEFSCLRKLQHAAHECDRVRGKTERGRERVEVCEGTVILLPLAPALAWHCWSFEHSCNPVRCVCVSVCAPPHSLSHTIPLTLSECAPRRSESLHFIFVYHLFTTQFFYYFSRARLPRWGQLISYAK